MRNLKKILALVLALVMSLSLMATAGASSFPDVDAENPYATAIEVLDELKVFQGYKEDGTFRPTETLNRAQAAVLVYRIATGDVEDKYLDNYTYMQQSKFTDLDGYNWAKGYINYCQNAGIVVGTSATTFDPGAKVTGYQLLVMLLRTLGYGKAGEFADPKGWELQTATIAEREGITKNVTSGDFGAPAPRQMVAEILFRGLLTETVEYSALVPGGYTKSGETLGMREFGLEKVSGVVMSNEWANLEGDKVIAADTTVLKVDGKNITVNKGTELNAVGLTYNAYIANGEGSTKRALTLEEGDNTVAFNEGKATGPDTDYSANREWASIEKLADTESISIKDSTEYFVNYDQAWNEDCTSEYLIRYAIAKTSIPGDADNKWNKYIAELNADTNKAKDKKTYPDHSIISRTIAFNTSINAQGKPVTENLDCWVISIRPDTLINEMDQDIMEEIFYTADRIGDNITENGVVGALRDYAIGEVYVGTTSMKDYSDTMSWKGFKEEYFNDTLKSRRFTSAENGESLRVIDNNNDGTAEYVLKIEYVQDKVVGTYKDAALLNSLKVADYSGNNLYDPDEIAAGDIVNYTVIDKKLSIWKADVLTDVVKTKHFNNITITTNGGEDKGQSGIDNATLLDENIMMMDEKVEYNMYLDEFGFVRSYELAQGSQYALLTELYPTGNQNFNYVKNFKGIVEMKMGEADIDEYNIANSDGSVFFSDSVWTIGTRGYWNSSLYNYLQPAIAHLGNPGKMFANYYAGKTDNGGVYKVPAWNRIVTGIEPQTVGSNYYGVFDYDAVNFTAEQNAASNTPGTAPATFSFTNVAAYTMDDDNNVTLKSASQLSYNQNGEQMYRVGASAAIAAGSVNNDDPLAKGTIGTKDELIAAYAKVKNVNETVAKNDWWNVFSIYTNGQGIYPVYKVDYVQLEKQGVKANTVHYTIDEQYDSVYNTWSNNYVNATVDTEFYIVMPNGVQYKMGFAELPTIAKEKVRAAYAVATNTNANASGRDYWVADVIVIEVDSLEYSYDSISLMYYNPRETSGSVRYVNSLNNEWRALQPDSDEKAKITVIPDSTNESGAYTGWGNTSWSTDAYGFYTLYNTEMDENNDLVAADAQMITKEWNSYGIYVGTIQRTERLVKSGYIDVDTLGRTNLPEEDKDVLPFFVGDAPFYRVTETNASDITLTPVNKYSDVQLDDEVIIVYNKAKNTVAYVVDLGYRKDSYTAPSWLLNDKDYQAGTNNTVKTYGGTNDANSLYCKILWEQQNGKGTSTPIGDYTVTVKAEYTDADGVQKFATIDTTGVATNGQLTVTGIAGLTLTGYTNDVATSNLKINGQTGTWTGGSTVVDPNSKFTAVVNDGTNGFAGALYITGIKTDIEIVIPFVITENSIETGTAGANVTKVEATAKWGVNNTQGVKTYNGTVVGAGAADIDYIPYGAAVELTVTSTVANPANLKVVVADSADVKDDIKATFVRPGTAANTYIYTFTMPGYDVQIEAGEQLPEYTVKFVGDHIDEIADVTTTWVSAVTKTPAVDPGYSITDVTAVETGTSNEVTVTWDGTDLTIAAGTNKNVTVTIETEALPAATTVTVEIDAAMETANAVSNVLAGASVELPDGTKEVLPLPANGEVELANPMWLVFDSTAEPDVSVTGTASVRFIKETTGNYTYQITGLAGGETITIGAAAPAEGSGAMDDTDGSVTGGNFYALVAEADVAALDEAIATWTVLTEKSTVATAAGALTAVAADVTSADNGKTLYVFSFTNSGAANTDTLTDVTKVGVVSLVTRTITGLASGTATEATIPAAGADVASQAYATVVTGNQAALTAAIGAWTTETTKTDVTAALAAAAIGGTLTDASNAGETLTGLTSTDVLVLVQFNAADEVVAVATVTIT